MATGTDGSEFFGVVQVVMNAVDDAGVEVSDLEFGFTAGPDDEPAHHVAGLADNSGGSLLVFRAESELPLNRGSVPLRCVGMDGRAELGEVELDRLPMLCRRDCGGRWQFVLLRSMANRMSQRRVVQPLTSPAQADGVVLALADLQAKEHGVSKAGSHTPRRSQGGTSQVQFIRHGLSLGLAKAGLWMGHPTVDKTSGERGGCGGESADRVGQRRPRE